MKHKARNAGLVVVGVVIALSDRVARAASRALR